MMQLPTTTEERIDQALARRVCTDTSGAYLTRSDGRRKSGRPTKYYLHRPDAMPKKFEAYSDEEAVELANGYLPTVTPASPVFALAPAPEPLTCDADPNAEQPKPIDPFDKSFAAEYELARRIGDKRFGSECKHENVTNGRCDKCMRKVFVSTKRRRDLDAEMLAWL